MTRTHSNGTTAEFLREEERQTDAANGNATFVVAHADEVMALEQIGFEAVWIDSPALPVMLPTGSGSHVVLVGVPRLPADLAKRVARIDTLTLPPHWRNVCEVLQWRGSSAELDPEETQQRQKAWLDFVRERQRVVREQAQKKTEPSAIAAACSTLQPGLLSMRPPPRDYLLRWPTRDGQPAPPRQGDGFAPMGVAGFLTSEGGVGKTGLLLALGVAVVTGRPWLGYHVDAAHVGQRVLLVLAEENEDEVHRRLYAIAEFYDLSEEERRLVERRLLVLPMAGKPCALAEVVEGRPMPTREFADLLRILRDTSDPWALVVLDPLARLFPGAETSNELATFAVQMVEQLTEVPGKPLLLLAHHSSKAARQQGEVDNRGVTGLPDAARWNVTLKNTDSGLVEFKQGKSNYSAPMPQALLLRRERGGLLRLATDGEIDEVRTAKTEAREERRAEAGHARNIADAAALAVVMVAQPGSTGRDIEGAMRAKLGTWSTPRQRAALSLLGDAVVTVPGTRNSELHHLDGAKVPGEVLLAIPPGERPQVATARPETPEERA